MSRLDKIFISFESSNSGDISDKNVIKETLLFDREEGALLITSTSDKGINVIKRYETAEGVNEFLDNQDDNLFRCFDENTDNVIPYFEGEPTYDIVLEYEDGHPYTASGVFDKFGLPVDYEQFVEDLHFFIEEYGLDYEGLFNDTLYEKERRCEDEYIFLSIAYEPFGKTAFYMAEDDNIKEGDYVLINRDADTKVIARVEEVVYADKDNAPCDIDTTADIIRKCSEEDLNTYEFATGELL